MTKRKESDMRTRFTIRLPLAVFCGLLCFTAMVVLSPRAARAQGKAAADWMTANATPQRDAWVRTDGQISRQNMQSMKGFGVVRKVQLGGAAGQTPLPAFDLLANARGGYGFKSIGYITDADGNAWGIDSDTGLVFWKTRVSPAPTGVCAGALSAGVVSMIPLVPTAAAGRGGGGRAAPQGIPANFPGRGVGGAMVGGPDEGAPSLKYYGFNAAPAAAPGRGGAAGASGFAGGGRGAVTVTGGTVGNFPEPLAIPFPPVTIGGTPTGGRGAVAAPGVFVLTSDGNARSLSEHGGYDIYMPPTKFLPANSNAFGLIALDSTQANAAGMAAAAAAAAAAGPVQGGGGGGRGGGGGAPLLYVATSNACGGTPGVWALDLSTPEKTVSSWKTNGGSVAGTAGPALGTDGTLYAATADGDYTPAAFSDSVVSLEAGSLKMKDFFTPGKSAFVSSPVVINHNKKDLVAVMNQDGKMYLLDSASLGGADHKTPLSASAKFANITTTGLPGALASWQDADGTRWVLTSVAGALASTAGFQTNGNVTSGAVVALKVVDQGGKATLQPGWVSRDIASPLPPIVVNGVVFVAGVGPQRNAVLYALDGSTGKEFLNTGNAMTAAPKGALSAQFSTIYVQTADNVLWSLGFPQDKEDYGAISR
jgi:hypothetical protein